MGALTVDLKFMRTIVTMNKSDEKQFRQVKQGIDHIRSRSDDNEKFFRTCEDPLKEPSIRFIREEVEEDAPPANIQEV